MRRAIRAAEGAIRFDHGVAVITLRWALFTVALVSMLAGAAISAFAA